MSILYDIPVTIRVGKIEASVNCEITHYGAWIHKIVVGGIDVTEAEWAKDPIIRMALQEFVNDSMDYAREFEEIEG